MILHYMFYSCIVSFLMSFFGIKYFMILLKKHNKFQPIRNDGPEQHLMTKTKTPTMGGVVISLSLLLNILLFCDLTSPYIKIAMCLIITFSALGLIDDVVKVLFNNTKGFAGSKKLIIQLITTSVCILYLMSYNYDYLNYQIHLPLFNFDLNFDILIVTVYVLIICGSANATNITDGLDGLLSLPIIFISITFSIIVLFMLNGYSFSNINIDNNLLYNILIILSSIIISFSCFLFYNHNPAKIFMGDVGSLMIGAILCYISILLKIEFLYGIMSILFVIEILSSVIQVSYYKITHGKRLFKMSPFHHHLEKCGWTEKKIVKSMWFFSFICCVVSLLLFLI